MAHDIPGGRGPLMALAVVHLISSLAIANAAGDRDPEEIVAAYRTAAILPLILGVAFLALWAWAKSSPLQASVTGLVLFLGLQLLNALLHPAALAMGLVFNLIALFFLVRSIIAARAALAWEAMERARPPGS
jgi:hypothetical protein